jgi:two-component system OmpR family response regulator/two-component system copper resistance phosphate regulon response regulator CusR
MAMKLLLVEDDSLLGKSIRLGLIDAGHQCRWVTHGEDALRQLLAHSFDAIILDLGLPDISGLEVLKRLREAGDHVAVLVLTALGSVDERVNGLNTGADDYLVKPFSFAELVARLEALVRRADRTIGTKLREGPLCLDLITRCVTRGDREIELTPTEFSLLEFLIRNSNQVVTRRMLCEHQWDSNWEGVTNVIEVHINRLRAKIDRGFDEQLIKTVRSVGYILRTR